MKYPWLNALLSPLTRGNRSQAAALDFAEGERCYEAEKFDQALASYDQAIALKPDFAQAYSRRGCVLQDLGRMDDALESCDRAITLDPHYANPHCNRGNLLRVLNRREDALACYDRAIALNPDLVVAHINRGNILQELMQFDAALASHDRAVALGPDFAGAYCNRGSTLLELQQLDAAIASFNKAIEIQPNYADAYFNKSLALLLAGDFENGWALHEWRWRIRSRKGHDSGARQPLWLGKEPLNGKTILLSSEQGLGDTLQFCRYAKLVSDLGAKVILTVPKPLKRLLADLAGVAQIIASEDVGVNGIDYCCPLMSLPLAFKTTLKTIPAAIPYIQSDAAKVMQWKTRLGVGNQPRVGLVWSGGFRPDQPHLRAVNDRRNIALDLFKPFKGLPVTFYSLQKGDPAESEFAQAQKNGWDGPAIMNYASELDDFTDTAALIENLDLVISVDTSTAHLAAALGKPVWILNRFDTCWRWLLDRSDSPWYPTVTLYRQKKMGTWDDVIKRVRADLSVFCTDTLKP